MGFDKNSFERCRSGIVYVLNELSNDGHCYGTREQLLEEAEKILELEKTLIDTTLNKMIVEKTVMLDEGDSIFLLPFYFSELGIAKRMKAILAVDTLYPTTNVDGIVEMIQKQYDISYDEVQKDAVKTAAASKFMVLTGGPGTGKTTITLAIIKVFQLLGARVLLAAPMGRAAKRMSETTGMEAKTIHRLLEYRPTEGYKKNAEYPLECDVLIIEIKNNYDKNVFNGDIGSITKIDTEERTLALNFDGNMVDYDATELDEVVLAYATTIHKSQGSEYKIVVAPLTMQHYVMLQRNLLYTCVTRAKKVFVLVGTKKAVAMAVRNNKTSKRNTRLEERLRADNNNDMMFCERDDDLYNR